MSGLTHSIYLGKEQEQKRSIVRNAVDVFGDVDRIFVFHGTKEAPDFNFSDVPSYYVPWPETEMYRTFYPLLGQPYKGQDVPAITDKSLLIVDEMLMTRERSVLRYNCMHHFLRVSERRIVFNYFPFIEDEQDFMILADFAQPDRYKREPFSKDVLPLANIVRRVPNLARTDVPTTYEDRREYERKKENLFDTLGDKDPDTIPRNLILLAGKIKARAVHNMGWYVARNRRIRRSNIVTYADSLPAGEPNIHILDPTYKRRDLIEFIRRNGIQLLDYIATALPVDTVYYSDLTEWIDRLEALYDAADIH